MTERTDRDRTKDTKRQQAHRAKSTGLPGRHTPEFLFLQERIAESFKERYDSGNGNGLTVINHKVLRAKGCSEQQAELVNFYIHPDSRFLTNQQVAEIVGCNRDTVGDFLRSELYLDIMSDDDVYRRRTLRLEDKATVALERNIDLGDNQSITTALKLSGRLKDSDSKAPVEEKHLHIHVHDSLKSLEPANAVEVEFTVEEGKDG